MGFIKLGLVALTGCILSTTISAQSIITACPTITKTTYRPSCTTHPICATPDCILLSVLTNGCGCPTAVPTKTAYWTDCGCHAGCGVDYETSQAACKSTTTVKVPTTTTTPPPVSSTIKTSTTVSCPTVTVHAIPSGQACPDICVAETQLYTPLPTPGACVTSSVFIPCSCSGLATKTVCPNCTPCTSYVGIHAPCPFSTMLSVVSA